MKKLKLTAAVLSAALVLQFAVPAFAAQPGTVLPETEAAVTAEADADDDNGLFDPTYTLTRRSSDRYPVSYEIQDKTGSYTFTSSNPSVVTVSSTGVVTAQGLGFATVTRTKKSDPEKVKKYDFRVEDAKLQLNESSIILTLTYDEHSPVKQLKIADSYGHINYTNWSSSNPEVATVDSSGFVTGHKEGTARISASTNEGTVSCSVTVDSTIGAVYFTSDPSVTYSYSTYQTVVEAEKLGNIKVGDVVNLSNYLRYDSRTQIRGWSSDNPEVATVTDSGWVTAMGEGTATITVTSTEGKTAECRVIIGQAAQQEYRAAQERSEEIGDLLVIGALGVVVVYMVVTFVSSMDA